MALRIAFTALDSPRRAAVWHRLLTGRGDALDPDELALRYRFGPGRIARAIELADGDGGATHASLAVAEALERARVLTEAPAPRGTTPGSQRRAARSVRPPIYREDGEPMPTPAELHISTVKELLDGISDTEIRALCVEALRTWRRTHPNEGQVSLHAGFGLEVVPLLLAHKGRPPATADTLSGLKEPFITEQNKPWFLAVSDFLGWFFRAGFGDPISWGNQNVVTVRLTRIGMAFLDATEDHPFSPGFVDRLRQRCPGLPTQVIALLADAQACMERMLLRPAIVLMGVAYETTIESVANHLVAKSALPAAVQDQGAAKRIATVRGAIDAVLPGSKYKDDREAAARAYDFADDLRRRRNDASHTTPRYGFEDTAEAQELFVSAGRQLPLIWSLVR